MTDEEYRDQAALMAMQGYIIYLGNNGLDRDLSWIAKKGEELALAMVLSRRDRELTFVPKEWNEP